MGAIRLKEKSRVQIGFAGNLRYKTGLNFTVADSIRAEISSNRTEMTTAVNISMAMNFIESKILKIFDNDLFKQKRPCL